jgi:hypothetical protein
MDLAAVFLGGLGASLLASGIAYVGARRLQNEAIQRREKGLTRAVYYEIGKIGTDLQIAVEAERGMPYVSTATFDQAAGDVAMFLSPRDFDQVALAYYLLSHYQARDPADAIEPGQLPEILRRVEAAREVLANVAFTKAELAARGIPGSRPLTWCNS